MDKENKVGKKHTGTPLPTLFAPGADYSFMKSRRTELTHIPTNQKTKPKMSVCSTADQLISSVASQLREWNLNR